MAITNSNELNEMLTLALGRYWIERGLPADKEQLDSIDSYLRSYAEVLMSNQEVMGALQEELDVDPGREKRMWGAMQRLTAELANVLLFIADSARSFSNDADLHVRTRNSASHAVEHENA